jgi:hypothetical protein
MQAPLQFSAINNLARAAAAHQRSVLHSASLWCMSWGRADEPADLSVFWVTRIFELPRNRVRVPGEPWWSSTPAGLASRGLEGIDHTEAACRS